jgi:hypothetical protein
MPKLINFKQCTTPFFKVRLKKLDNYVRYFTESFDKPSAAYVISEKAYANLKGQSKAISKYLDDLEQRSYELAKSFGEQKIELPSEIDKQVKKYIKKIDNEYFFFNPKTGNKLTSPNITLMINSIFGKRVSTNLLRHIFVSNKYKDIPAIKELDATSTAMGHDLRTALEMYVKH